MNWFRTLLPIWMSISILAGYWQQPEFQPPLPQPEPFSDRYPAEILVNTRQDYDWVLANIYDVDNVQPIDPAIKLPLSAIEFTTLRVTAYINPAEAELLRNAGLEFTPIVNESRLAAELYGPGTDQPGSWPSYDAYVARWQGLAAAHPEIVQVIQIGTSYNNKAIWCLKVTDNPELQEIEPEVKFSAAIHGDETTGIELTTRLAELLANSYGTDSRLTNLVNTLETWICPIHNPDGYVNSSRYNGNGKDLNRIFPDPVTDPVDTTAGNEPENIAFMELGYTNRFSLGINYHGGAQVVNYPWDSKPLTPPYYSPDDSLFYSLSTSYANLNPDLRDSEIFEGGVTVGWEWYIVRGGMQDWAYNWRDELHVTIEVSSVKAPNFSLMDGYWNNNREAMLVWMEKALTGVQGLVTDSVTGLPLDASLTILENDRTLKTDPDAGDYHRPLLPGSYNLTAASACHIPQTIAVTIPASGAVEQNFSLQPTGVFGLVLDQLTQEPVPAVIRILAGSSETTSDLLTGEYTLSLCPGEFTLQVEAPGYQTQERDVSLADMLIEDFYLAPEVSSQIFLPAIVSPGP